MKFENKTDYFNYVACFFLKKNHSFNYYFLLLTWCLGQLTRTLINFTDSKVNNHISF
jgi:hypothetical protein